MNAFLIFLVIILVGFRAIDFVRKIAFSWKVRKKNKPKKATECHYCKIEITDAKVVRHIECKHPFGKDLSKVDNPLDCVSDCIYGFEYFSNLKLDQTMMINSFERTLLNEIITLATALVPGFIALYKLIGDGVL